MSSQVHRRLRLPADDRTPSLARAAVRQVLVTGAWTDRLDEALLLVSELATNAVVHARTGVDLDVVVDDGGVTVTVADGCPGLISAPAPVRGNSNGALAESGRGLFLVDRIATEWGAPNHREGKCVWFRLGPE